MKTVERIFDAQTEVNRSKFLSFLVPYAEFDHMHASLKAQHPKANHIVYAVRHLNEYGHIVENSSDDGEPKGCAGVPALNVLRGEELVACGVLIVRYFGGIKLGTGGMARAYAQAVKDVIAKADIVPYKKRYLFSFFTPYQDVRQTEYRLLHWGIEPVRCDYGSKGVTWFVMLSEKEKKRFEAYDLIEIKEA